MKGIAWPPGGPAGPASADEERILRTYQRWHGRPAWRRMMPFRLARATRDRVYYRNLLRAAAPRER